MKMKGAETFKMAVRTLGSTALRALEKAGVAVESADQAMLAKQTMTVDAVKARQNLRLVEHLEDLEDVQRVTSNLEISDELLAEVAG